MMISQRPDGKAKNQLQQIVYYYMLIMNSPVAWLIDAYCESLSNCYEWLLYKKEERVVFFVDP